MAQKQTKKMLEKEEIVEEEGFSEVEEAALEEATLEEQERWAELIKQEADAEKKKAQILSKINDEAWAQIRQSEAQNVINNLTSD